jgi:hypothetical protein
MLDRFEHFARRAKAWTEGWMPDAFVFALAATLITETVSIRQGVNARGQEYDSAYAAKVDGREYPRAVKGSDALNTIAFTRVDADTVALHLA